MNLQFNRGVRALLIFTFGSCASIALAQGEVAETAKSAEKEIFVDVKAPVLEPLDVHARTSLTVVEQLRHNHFVKKPLDDGISSHVFDNYLETLDGGRSYFLATDIAEFEAYRYELDDALKRGNLDAAFTMFNRYQERVVDRLNFLIHEIEGGIENIDFTVDEDIEIDRENSPWPANQAEHDALWRKRLKAAVLSMKLNDKEVEKIGESLTKRYKNRLKQAVQTKSEDAFQVYLNSFATTYDPHTQYFSPRTSQNFNINMSLSLEGIGAVLKSEDDTTSVVRLVPAGPADKEGSIGVEDKIISVGQGENGPLIDVVGWRLDDVVELIRGPKDSTVRLEVIPSDSKDEVSKVVAITRNTVKLEEQAAQAKLLTLEQGNQAYKIGIIDVPTFYVDFRAAQQGDDNYRSTTRDVKNLIHKLEEEGIDGLVIDLRNNGGGSLQEADTLTGLFIESGPTVQVKSARRRANVYADTDDDITWDGPMAVMVNRLSASASEIFAGAIQDYGRGVIIGSQTFGKGTVQTLIPLNRGQLKITAAKFYRVSGQSTQHQGVLPDVSFPELYDTDQIGESSLEDAMPWDMIQPAVYDHNNAIAPFIGELQRRHEARVADNVDFNYVRALAAKSKEAAARTHVSLNKDKRLAQKEADDQWRLDLENMLRAAKGKELATSLDHLDDLVEAEKEAKEAAEKASDTDNADAELVADAAQAPGETEEDVEIKAVEDDAMLEEAGKVLLDLMGLSMQIAQLETPASISTASTGTPLPQPTADADTDVEG
ncbi:MAG: carboxy terminal-processing peptidase [Pseudomonadales bacterium]|jgi:carboxyl-terminal processing protease|nr:carboxy terminal-processing peptidase [Pseudomonadales bacterium]